MWIMQVHFPLYTYQTVMTLIFIITAGWKISEVDHQVQLAPWFSTGYRGNSYLTYYIYLLINYLGLPYLYLNVDVGKYNFLISSQSVATVPAIFFFISTLHSLVHYLKPFDWTRSRIWKWSPYLISICIWTFS